MSRWRTIVITDGDSNLHTFDYVPRVEEQERNATQPRLAWHHRAILDGEPNLTARSTKQREIRRPGMSPTEFGRVAAHQAGYRRYLPQTFNHVPLEDISARLAIADGFNPTGQTLAVILDALRIRDVSLSLPR
jgi:hypothetical protein